MKIAGLDTETTGLDLDKGDRVIELCVKGYDDSGNDLGVGFTTYFNPEGRPIAKEAFEVHGIAMSKLVGAGTFKNMAPTIDAHLRGYDLIVIHNAQFDKEAMAMEFANAGLHCPMKVYCTMENGRWATFDGKLPTLKELCFALSVEYDPSLAHAAEYDVGKMMECFFAGRRRGFYADAY